MAITGPGSVPVMTVILPAKAYRQLKTELKAELKDGPAPRPILQGKSYAFELDPNHAASARLIKGLKNLSKDRNLGIEFIKEERKQENFQAFGNMQSARDPINSAGPQGLKEVEARDDRSADRARPALAAREGHLRRRPDLEAVFKSHADAKRAIGNVLAQLHSGKSLYGESNFGRGHVGPNARGPSYLQVLQEGARAGATNWTEAEEALRAGLRQRQLRCLDLVATGQLSLEERVPVRVTELAVLRHHAGLEKADPDVLRREYKGAQTTRREAYQTAVKEGIITQDELDAAADDGSITQRNFRDAMDKLPTDS